MLLTAAVGAGERSGRERMSRARKFSSFCVFPFTTWVLPQQPRKWAREERKRGRGG
jgi:hypothetical protein